MNIYIVTGTTRGLGRALAETITAGNDHLLSLSRSPDHSEHRWHNVQCEFGRPLDIPGRMHRLLDCVRLEEAGEIILINNAGLLEPMGPADTIEPELILNHLNVNQAAPVILMSAFIRLTQGFLGKRRIINISSGAGVHPYAGWAMYCASKAALNMMTQCIAAEQQLREYPVTVCAVSPGKIETDMQAQVRAADSRRFPAREEFIQAKLRGDLMTPKSAARMLLMMDKQGYFKNGGLYDLREIMDRQGLSAL